jgi:putative transposase
MCGELSKDLGMVFRTLARQKDCEVEERHLMPNHEHILVLVPPKYPAP